MQLEFELLYTENHQRFYRLNFPVSSGVVSSTHYLCISDAFVVENYERYAFPAVRHNEETDDYFELTVYYLEVQGYRVPQTEGDFDFLPEDADIIRSLFISYKNTLPPNDDD